jgi:hypothetical protein
MTNAAALPCSHAYSGQTLIYELREGLAGVSVDAPSIRTRNSVFYWFGSAVMGINRVKVCFFVFRYTSDNAISGREWSAHICPYYYCYLVFIIF